jgi:hypothetical protein
MTLRAARHATCRTAILPAAIIALLSPPATAATIEYDVAGHRLVLPVPAGFCTIDRSVEVQRELGEKIERVMSQRDVYLGIAIDCGELAALEDAPERGFSTYIIWVAEGDGSGEPVLYPDIARDRFVEQADAQATPVDGFDASQEATDLWQQELDSDTLEVESLELGAIGHDANAHYTTGLARIGSAQGELVQATVTLGTLIDGLHVQAFLYRPFQGERSFDGLTAAAEALAEAMVAANPDSDPAGGGLGIDIGAVLRSALLGGVLGGAVGGIIWILRRMRRSPGRHFD